MSETEKLCGTINRLLEGLGAVLTVWLVLYAIAGVIALAIAAHVWWKDR